jgi:hypothetical protein
MSAERSCKSVTTIQFIISTRRIKLSESDIIIIIIIIIIDSLQKTAILGTSHIIRKVLQCEA